MKNPVRNRRTSKGATRPTKGKGIQGLARVLRACGLILLAGVSVFAIQQVAMRFNQPIKEIQLSGNFDQARSSELESQLETYGGQGLLAIDLDALRVDIETTPWVSKAVVSRQWPNTLVVNIEEHRLVARWNQQGYVSDQSLLVGGYVVEQSLPLLQSRANEPVALLQEYRRLSQAMAQIDLQLIELRESGTGDLELLLDNGILLKLGNRNLLDRIQRFVAIWELDLHRRESEIGQIDVRYANGLAVNWNAGALESAGVQHLGESYGELARR